MAAKEITSIHEDETFKKEKKDAIRAAKDLLLGYSENVISRYVERVEHATSSFEIWAIMKEVRDRI